jgi:hypothetical protein
VINTPLGLLHVTTDRSLPTDQSVTLLIRSEAAEIQADPFAAASDEWFAEAPPANVLTGTLREVSFRGRYRRVVVEVNEIDLVFEIETPLPLPGLGQPVKISLSPEAIRVI